LHGQAPKTIAPNPNWFRIRRLTHSHLSLFVTTGIHSLDYQPDNAPLQMLCLQLKSMQIANTPNQKSLHLRRFLAGMLPAKENSLITNASWMNSNNRHTERSP
jgi:hypothetical protein